MTIRGAVALAAYMVLLFIVCTCGATLAWR
jgi:hypothetical protein